jgi:transcriptional antiterminator RfaH
MTGKKLQEDDQIRAQNAAWFCLQSFQKREHIAAAYLTQRGADIYLPRIRFQRATRRGTRWFIEPLFPNYLFARFEPEVSLRRMSYSLGVKGVVHFGNHWPTIPVDVIDSLRAIVRADQPYVVQPELQPGQSVTIAGGLFHGFEAVITKVMPARERVAVLLEFLGTQTMLELPSQKTFSQERVRPSIIGRGEKTPIH